MNKKYKFTNKKHSPKAIMATVLGIISLASLIMVIYLSYSQGSDSANRYGVTGFLIMLFSLIGIILEFNSLKEQDQYAIYVWIGFILNMIAFLGIIAVVAIGMYF